MFSPAKTIIAGALAIAVGSVAYLAQPFEQQGGVPAAQGPVAPTWVTGSMQPVDGSCLELSSSNDDGFTRNRYECAYTSTSSDPRLTGDVSRPWNEDSYQTDEGPISVGMEASFLRNEGGDWACWYGYLVKGAGPMTSQSLTEDTHTYTCSGGSGYEGLSAVLVSERPDPESFSEEFVGLIFSGDLPPLPEPAPAE